MAVLGAFPGGVEGRVDLGIRLLPGMALVVSAEGIHGGLCCVQDVYRLNDVVTNVSQMVVRGILTMEMQLIK